MCPAKQRTGIYLVGLLLAACSAPGGDTERSYVPADSLPNHDREVVAAYFGGSWCPPCQRPDLKKAIRTMQVELSERSQREGFSFASLGVAMDWSVPQGVEFLRETSSFDEVVVGRNWANSAVIDLIWSKPGARTGVPQVVVYERSVKIDSAEFNIEYGNRDVLRRLTGADQIVEWVDKGMPLHRGSRSGP